MVISFPIVVVFVRCRVFPVQSIDVKAALKPRNSGITQMNCLVYAVAVVVAVATADNLNPHGGRDTVERGLKGVLETKEFW